MAQTVIGVCEKPCTKMYMMLIFGQEPVRSNHDLNDLKDHNILVDLGVGP